MEPTKFVGNTVHVSRDIYQGLLNSEKELIEIKKHGKDMVRITTAEYSNLLKERKELIEARKKVHVPIKEYWDLVQAKEDLIEVNKKINIAFEEYQDFIRAKEVLMNLKSPNIPTQPEAEIPELKPFSLGSKVEVTEQEVKGEKSVEEILTARRKTCGDFRKQATITDNLKYHMKNTENWSYLTAVQKEALDMIVHKIGRILAGDPNLKDHWDDIAGYSMLSAKELI